MFCYKFKNKRKQTKAEEILIIPWSGVRNDCSTKEADEINGGHINLTTWKVKTSDIYKYQKTWKFRKEIGGNLCSEGYSQHCLLELWDRVSALWNADGLFNILLHINSSLHHFKYRSGKHKLYFISETNLGFGK